MSKSSGSKRKDDSIVFKRQDNIGAIDAANDSFLSECFVDNGFIDIMKDCSDHRSIIIGRTGVGKTALFKKFSDGNAKVILFDLEVLSFDYISNSSLISYWLKQGVNMNTFFKFLWRHVFSVALLRKKYGSDMQNRRFAQVVDSLFSKDDRKKKAVEYLNKWGDSFWKEEDFRVKEIVTSLESNIQASIGVDSSSSGGSRKSSSSVKEEPSQVVQRVVDGSQMRELGSVLDFLCSVFDDRQDCYYILIDGLDEDWADESVKYKLIRSMIETLKDFVKVDSVKIMISMRWDLFESVVMDASKYGSGFQVEKYRNMTLPILWSNEHLKDLIDKRIALLFKRRYTKEDVGFDDVFDPSIGSIRTFDWMVSRTLKKPRDIIDFINRCIAQSDGEPKIKSSIVTKSFPSYSSYRLESIFDEWSGYYKSIRLSVYALRGVPSSFNLNSYNRDFFDNIALSVLSSQGVDACPLFKIFNAYFESKNVDDKNKLIYSYMYHMHRIGVVSLKVNPQYSYVEYGQGDYEITIEQVNGESLVKVSAVFQPALSVSP